MARYIGPKARVSRRLGTNLWGTRGETIALDRRPYPPGEHGRTRRRTNASEYLIQLQEKQKARFSYGLSERQFHNLYEEANRRPGVTGENMLRFLELRLDNVVYRAGWAATRPQARQFVGHGMLNVNGRRVDIPSFRVRKGDVVQLRPKARELIIIRHNVDVLDRTPPGWLETGEGGNQVTVRELPLREQIDVPVREQLIVELYSK
jgi:small subunit ribosomal protein S4